MRALTNGITDLSRSCGARGTGSSAWRLSTNLQFRGVQVSPEQALNTLIGTQRFAERGVHSFAM